MKKNNFVQFDIPKIISKMKLEEGQHVADLGCGNFGFFVWPLAKIVGRSGVVYAVDVLKGNLEEIRRKSLKENFPQVKTVWSNLEVFKGTLIEASSLDAAFLVNVLNQSEKRLEILRETLRLLKRHGQLMIIDWHSEDNPLGPKPEQRVRLESLKISLEKFGFEIKEEFFIKPFSFGLILTKL